MAVDRLIMDEIYSRLDRETFLRELGLEFKASSNSFGEIPCPACKEPRAYLYRRGIKLICNRTGSCGRSWNLWDLVQERKGLTGSAVLQELARIAGYELPPLGDGARIRLEEAKSGDALLGEALEFFKAQLWTEAGKETLSYLKGRRGYSEEEVRDMDLGHNPGASAVREALVNKGYNVNIVNKYLTYLSSREDYRLVIPYRDAQGFLKGLVGRLTRDLKAGEKEEDKYKPFGEATGLKDTPLLMDRARGMGEIVAVEGYLDALIAQARGVGRVVAVGGSTVLRAQAESLSRYKVKRVILSLDEDEAGRKGTESSIKILRAHGIQAYVVPPLGAKDPDEHLRSHGPEDYKELIRKAERSGAWLGRRLVDGADLKTDLGRAALEEEALRIDSSLPDAQARDGEDLLEVVAEATGHTLETLRRERRSMEDTAAQERIQKEARQALREASEGVESGDLSKLQEYEERLRALRMERDKIKAIPKKTLSERIRAKQRKDRERKPGLLGYELKLLKKIAKNIDGVQPGLYIVGAYTNRGKTALLTNLLLDLLRSNSDLRALYFSLDDSTDVITNRLLAILGPLEINMVQKPRELDPRQTADLERAYGELLKWTEGGRLEIMDLGEVSHIDRLEAEVRERAETGLVVFVDGLYNLEIGKVYGGKREEAIELANKVKALVDTYGIPLIASGELRKPSKDEGSPSVHDLMETGKVGYNANLVWTLEPENLKTFEEEDTPTLLLHYAKNKLSYFKGKQKLTFYRSNGQIIETL